MRRSLRRGAACAAALLSAGLPVTARADELTVTAQAVTAHGEFLTQAPPPPVQGVLCVVDSGVDLNPDTEPVLVGRESIFGGTLDDVSGTSHGTYVTMVAGAAANGWGMAGAWPQLKALSVRVMEDGGEQLSADAYRQGVQRCALAKADRGIDVRVIELAVGGSAATRTPPELAEIGESVDRARRNGMVVVSAAGNDGGPINVPASLSGVMAVTGFDRAGGLCAFSSRGAEADLATLGCGMDVAISSDGLPGEGHSTSLASAYVAGVVVALRSYRPDLSVEQTESLLRRTATPGPAGPVLDAAAAFRAAGLGTVVDAYRPPLPAASAPAQTRRVRCNAKRRLCSAPRLKSVRRRGRLVVIRLARVPAAARVIVRADGRRVSRAKSKSKIIRVKVRRWKLITVRFSRPGRLPSPVLRIKRSEVQ